MESAEAGTASRFISLTRAACVYWAIIRPESTPASSARKGGRPCERFLSRSRSVRRSAMEPRSAAAIARKSRTYATGAPWKLPLSGPRRSTGPPGCRRRRPVRARRRAGRGPGCRGRRRRPAGRSGSSRRPGRGGLAGLEVAGEAGALEHGQHVGGGGGLAGVGADGVQLGFEDLLGAEEGFEGERGGDVGRLVEGVEVGEGHDQHAEHAVGAVEEGEALLLLELDGRDAVLGEQLAGGADPPVGASASPSPMRPGRSGRAARGRRSSRGSRTRARPG